MIIVVVFHNREMLFQFSWEVIFLCYRRGAGVQGPMGWSNVIQRQELHHSAPHEQLHIRKYCILKIELLSFSSVAHITSLIVIVKL